MPRPKKKPPAVDVPTTPEEEFGVIDVGDLPADVDKVLAEIGDDVTRVIIYRKGKGEKQAYVGTMDADEFSMDEVASRWGGGRYVGRLVGSEGILKGVTFYIDESIKPTPKESTLAGAGAGAMSEKLLDRVLDKMGGDGRDPMAIAAQMQQSSASQAQAMVAAMMAAIAPLLAKITELGSGGGRGTSAQEMLSLIEFGAERFGEKDTGFAGVVRDVGLPLISIAERALGGRSALPRPSAPALTEGTPVAPAANPPAPAWVAAIKPYVGQIIAYAQANADTGLIAGMVDLQAPRFARWLEQVVVDPAFPDQLFAHFPALASHREWIGHFLAEFTPDDDSGGADGSAVTDAGGDDDPE